MAQLSGRLAAMRFILGVIDSIVFHSEKYLENSTNCDMNALTISFVIHYAFNIQPFNTIQRLKNVSADLKTTTLFT
jgi:hypothetical protein